MSHLLWKSYWEQDVDKFRRLLASAGQGSHVVSRNPAQIADSGNLSRSPVAHGSSPRTSNKTRRVSGLTPSGSGKTKESLVVLGKSEVNSRDHAGLTILLRAAASIEPVAYEFAQALLEHPAIDLYAQDPESGWNALHRSLYSGNVSIARMLLERERAYLTNHTKGSLGKVGLLIKTKDHEGNSPFDVYNSTIAARQIQNPNDVHTSDSESDGGDGAEATIEE